MKHLIVLLDGMADYPIKELDGKTPLAISTTPMMDRMAKTAKLGLVQTVPAGFKPGSDVANLGALGYDAHECYTGRSPLEALSIGIKLEEDDLSIRTNLVTLSDEPNFEDKTMVDYSAGEISTEESRELIEYIQQNLGDDIFHFYAGVSYRHCLVAKHKMPNNNLTPPHDITGKPIKEYMPKGELQAEFCDLIKKSYELLKNHPINQKRSLNGQNSANSLWFWGEGTKPMLQDFEVRYGKTAGMVSAVDLLKGIAIGANMTSVDVESATGTIHTNFDGKAQAVIDLFKSGKDFVFVHLEAPDECGHQGDLEGKIKSIELIDQKIIKPCFDYLVSTQDDFAVIAMPDHYTPLSTRTHASDPVPFMMFSSKETLGRNTVYNEETATNSGLLITNPTDLIKEFFAL